MRREVKMGSFVFITSTIHTTEQNRMEIWRSLIELCCSYFFFGLQYRYVVLLGSMYPLRLQCL